MHISNPSRCTNVIGKKKENRALPHFLSLPRRKKVDVLRVFDPSDSKLLVDFKKEVSSIKKALMDNIDNNTKLDGLRLGSGTPPPYASGYQIEGGSSVYDDDDDIFVGFEQEEATVKDRLVGELKKL
ncbi:hypothetical protein L6452_07633 [Arctium lappa]|uniref:Uncharacterized protein n=1 Tax=Arctium lappa TaxID=4217 RepID=A0ACB9ELQ9_ARCLA|nr:hypothetical protein L6452_07633 [Arctium lappa]